VAIARKPFRRSLADVSGVISGPSINGRIFARSVSGSSVGASTVNYIPFAFLITSINIPDPVPQPRHRPLCPHFSGAT
jgi:hypothetical protein